MISAAEFQAMQRALQLAASPDAPHGPNPRVGCVILGSAGNIIGQGYHHGIGTQHAEIVAIADAGEATHGATAVVTLEPCNHTGRTGPCVEALINAGISRVVFAQSDPNPIAAGGEAALRAAGAVVESGAMAEEATDLNYQWSIAVARQRPFVTVKLATTLDGRVAAADGTSRWISSPASRADAHRMRAEVDAVMVGAGTVIEDDPQLTDRRRNAAGHQPMRIVIGNREVPVEAKIRGDDGLFRHIQTRDLDAALAQIFAMDVRTILVEAGPTLATALIKAGLVDRLLWFVAPVLLGSGRSALEDLGIDTIDQALRWTMTDVVQVGSDVRLELTPTRDN